MQLVEASGPVWDIFHDRIAIPVSASKNYEGDAILQGVAEKVSQQFPGTAQFIGSILNVPTLGLDTWLLPNRLVMFPIKTAWFHPTNLAMVERSSTRLSERASEHNWDEVLIPRFSLEQEEAVIQVMSIHLDNRFVLCTDWEDSNAIQTQETAQVSA